jgi:RNA polymerase sigma-70 factor (ECF subfamily)
MDQQLVRLKYFEGLKYREISERTGLTVSNVGFRLHTIMQTLAKGLQPMERSELK